MKNRILKVAIIAVGLVLVSVGVMTVNKKRVSEKVDTAENTTEAVTTITETAAVMTTKMTTVMTTVTTITEIPKADELNLTEEEEWSFNNRSKCIYFTEDGCYYPVEIGGRQSANYVLCFEDLDGKQTIYEETEDYSSYYFDGNAIYLTTYGEITPEEKFNPVYMYHKLEDGELVTFKESEESIIPYFTEDYIYYKHTTNDGTEICRMDYNFENDEVVIEFGKNKIYLFDFVVYDDKIWYDYTNWVKEIPKSSDKIACYDINTGETKELNGELKLGRINNGYMYYTCGVKNDTLNRFNMKTGKAERVLGDLKWLYNFMYDFYENYILYIRDDKLYKYDGKSSEVVCTPDDIHPDESFWLGGSVQCQNGRIFIVIGSGAFYEEIVEIDIEGNVLNIIPEKPKG